jgi:hypothetical protein
MAPLRKGEGLITFVVLLGLIGWLAKVVWQLWLSRTKGEVRTRNGYVTRTDNPTVFELIVLVYWVHLIVGIGLLIVVLMLAVDQISK